MNENIIQTQINQILEIVKSHDNRFNAIENRFNSIEERIDERFDVLSEQIRQLDKQHGERLAKLEVITLGHDKGIKLCLTLSIGNTVKGSETQG